MRVFTGMLVALMFSACGGQAAELSDAQRIWCSEGDATYFDLSTGTYGDPSVLNAARQLDIQIPDSIELREVQVLTSEGIEAEVSEQSNADIEAWRGTDDYARACIAAYELRD